MSPFKPGRVLGTGRPDALSYPLQWGPGFEAVGLGLLLIRLDYITATVSVLACPVFCTVAEAAGIPRDVIAHR